MMPNVLTLLSIQKHERLLPRVFPGAVRIEVRDPKGSLLLHVQPGTPPQDPATDDEPADDPIMAWADFAPGIQRRELPSDDLQFRVPLQTRDFGDVGWLIVTFDVHTSVPMATAKEALRRAFSDAKAMIQEELDLQSECNQLAAELTERYEELNLVYSTQDQVEDLEEGQQALGRLVHNCVDFLDVGLATIICKERNVSMHSIRSGAAPDAAESLLELLATSIYDWVHSQVSYLIINENNDVERQRLLAGRPENVLAQPIVDSHGTAIGMVAVAARQDGHIFSNGDRNLLEVMAKKAARIIHTHHDSLTGLMNRNGFEPTLVMALGNARTKNATYCLLHIDIDQLHVINDLMGHQEGDSLIRRVAKILRSGLRDTDWLARLGGDEFAVLLSNCDVEQGHAVADKIRTAIKQLKVVSANRQLDVSASVGVASIDSLTEGIVGVMAAAEIACKSAKEGGRDRVQVFEEDNTSLVRRSEEVEWIGRIQQALREDTFDLHCQPVLPLADDGVPAHFEVLIRMRGDDGKPLSPAAFLPAAERYQLMPQIDRWVIRETLRILGECWDSIATNGEVFCINLSGQSLTNDGFFTFVADEIEHAQVNAEQICFEITETAAISNIDEALQFMNTLKTMGCRFSLDDFGAGLSSFGYLKVLPVDYLKIDGSFVREITTDKVSRSMVEAICQIGRTMGLAMVAEYVGDDETIAMLRSAGVDFGQGFHIGKPVPIKEITDRLQEAATAASA